MHPLYSAHNVLRTVYCVMSTSHQYCTSINCPLTFTKFHFCLEMCLNNKYLMIKHSLVRVPKLTL
uniref:Uncharacterized protein n=1 Tax=Anguilla anguilla TaxID=7936 RepID=A0A0E9WM02_ANGAN